MEITTPIYPQWRFPLVAVSLCLALGFGFNSPAQAQTDSTIKKIEDYRQALADGNPSELWEARGEEIWRRPAGPKLVSLEKCDLGLGPGIVKGAYSRLPQYFQDAGRVMDLETRIAYCRTQIQGIKSEDTLVRPFGNGTQRADNDALVAYITSESRGIPITTSINHPAEKIAYALGQRAFYYRGGTHDFACATCHGEAGRRIRLQDLPNLTDPKEAQRAYTTWPAYRVSQGELRTFQWRLYDCFRQQRFPELKFTSEISVALTTFLVQQAKGGIMDAPNIKR